VTPAEPLPVPPADRVRFHVQQRVSPFQNTYRVLADDGGAPGPLIAFAQQKRLAFKEQFTLFRDEGRSTPVLTIVADRRLDVRSTMTVREPAGTVVGVLRKRGAASLLRSTWEAEQPGRPLVVVQERSLAIALLRRAWNLVPWVGEVPLPFVFHFDGVDPAGRTVLTHERRWGLRDRYVLEVRPDALDPRLAIALAVCLDALQSR
jgi:uncharacterized protein YxjI